MDTKSKSFKEKKGIRTILFILAIIFLGGISFQLQTINQEGDNVEYLLQKEYHKSREFYYSYVRKAMLQVSDISYYLEEIKDAPFHYYITEGTREYSDTGHSDREYYSSSDKAFFYLQNGVWKSGTNSYKYMEVYNWLTDNYVAYIAFPKEFLDQKQQQWDKLRNRMIPKYILLLILVLAGAAMVLGLCVTSWKEASDTSRHSTLDRAYTEVHLLLLLLGGGGLLFILTDMIGKPRSIGLNLNFLGLGYYEVFTSDNRSMSLLIGGITVLASALLLPFLLSIIRKCKAKVFFKDSIIVQLGYRLFKIVKEILHYIIYYDSFSRASFTKKLYYRQSIFLIVTFINLTLVVFFLPRLLIWFAIPLVLELFASIWYFKGNKWILNNINREIQERMEEQMKSERMKVALVTNVSHDLKTPLTSIISFIDLLSKEEELSETALDYVRILQEKSERLKNIVNDLFDLAKSSSGDAVVEYEHLDLVKLIRQTLADMDDLIVSSQLQIKLILLEEPVSIYADGKKLYRVFQNVIDNAIKYALRGTRIIIEMKPEEERVVVWIKNIAGYEMNFTEQEILQRFFRGDQSRSTEGSGLGLSIAESFTKVCDGDFHIEIDGDMFKVAIGFTRVKKREEIPEKTIVK